MRKDLTGSKFMLFLLCWYVISIVITSFVIDWLYTYRDVNARAFVATPWFMISNQLVNLILPLMVWLLIKREKLRICMPNMKLGRKNILLIIGISLVLQPLMMLISAISGLFFTNNVSEVMYDFMQYPYWLILVAIAVTPAICEELVFRGYLQAKQDKSAFYKAALLNGLFFAIIHLSLQQFAYAFLMGIVFAYMVHYTRSIWAGILSHFIINASQVSLARAIFSIEPLDYEAAAEAEAALAALPISPEAIMIIFFAILAMCLSPLKLMLFKSFFNHNKERIAETENTEADEVEVTEDQVPENRPVRFRQKVDVYAIAVVVIFIWVMAFIMWASSL